MQVNKRILNWPPFLLLCFLANYSPPLVLKLEIQKDIFKATRANLRVNKRILKWRPFWNKVYCMYSSNRNKTLFSQVGPSLVSREALVINITIIHCKRTNVYVWEMLCPKTVPSQRGLQYRKQLLTFCFPSCGDQI